METLYEAAMAAAWPGVRVAAAFDDRARQAVEGRRETRLRFQEWGWAKRAADRPLVWLHAPSVGEALMAKAIIRALREEKPGLQVAFTHFSPSAERMVDDVGADVSGYMPWDTRTPVREALEALRPSVLVFVRTEVWPVAAREAGRAGVPMAMVNAVLSDGSGRLRWPARGFLEDAYRRLAVVGTVSTESATQYQRLGIPPDRIHVTGDARFDQVWDRIRERGLYGLRGEADSVDRVPDELRPLWKVLHDPDTFTVVAGSTWSEDEKVILPAAPVLGRSRRVRFIIAPHEPTPSHLDALEAGLERQPVQHTRLGALVAGGGPGPEVVIVDRMGVLADLYALADAAYVGGGFGTSGLHSVVEPAALGIPVLYGPAHGNSREAGELEQAGGGFVVGGPGEFEERLRSMMDDPGLARATGERARAYVQSEAGAAQRNAELILDLLSGTNAGEAGR
jgi:3-deoxy-D-manno-octulosonic-acid transferase